MREMTTYDLDALLGDEARAALLARRGQDGYDELLAVLADMPASDDDADGDRAHTNGVLMAALGDATLESLAGELARARAREAEALQTLLGACRWEAAHGMGEPTLSARTGLARTTIRRGLGR